MAVPKIYNVHTHIFNFKCVPSGFLTNYLPRVLVTLLAPLLRVGPIASAISFLLKKLPGNVRKYQAFVAVGIRNTPQKVFEDMMEGYNDENVGFVVLPMNFDYMGGGQAPANYKSQLELVADVKRKYPNTCFPFLAVDPRMGNANDILKFVKDYFEPNFKGFHGIKLYPALGFYPTDDRLEEMYKYAQGKNIPILTHCTRFGAYYAEKKVPEELLEYRSFNHTSVTNQRRQQTFYQNLLNLKSEDACDAFLDPVNYYDILDRFPDLKLCFAHYGGDEEMRKYLRNPNNQGVLHTGYNNDTSWYYIIKDLQEKFKNVYADISFTLWDTKPPGDIVSSIKTDLQSNIGDRVLFGTDFFMTLQVKAEKALYTDFRLALDNKNLWEQMAYHNNKKFMSSNFYPMP